MPRPGLSLSFLVLLSACTKDISVEGRELPQMTISSERVDFGEVPWGEIYLEKITIRNTGASPLGVSEIAIGIDEMEDNFILHLGTLIDCSDAVTDTEDASEDTGLTNMGIDDAHQATGSTSTASASIIIIEENCSYDFQVSLSPSTVGAIYGSVLVRTADDGAEEPTHYQDPDDAHKTIILQGSSSMGAGNIIVSPRTLDFAHPNSGETPTKYVEIHNVGNGPLTVQTPTLNDDCDPRFDIDFGRLTEGALTLDARTSTLLPITYTADDGRNAECEMTIESSDLDSPSSRVSLRGQMGSDPLCSPPSVDLISPMPGQIHGTSDDLVLELRIADSDQRPTSLNCSVTSAFNDDEEAPEELADCRPYSDSGYTLVNIPTELLMTGSDTLMVTVQDDCGLQATASVGVVWNADYPPGDNDHDGFASGAVANADCDDDDIWVYPNAPEIADGKDNDCDGEIDEGTSAMDDDGDSFSEDDGDCNDFDDTIYPGAPEQPDYKDNDCDGVIDDNTGLFDDDGDGFAETDNDCADNNPNIHPAAIEYCDGIDNNCNGLKDERDGCIEIDAAPMVLGEIQMSATAIGQGESTVMTIEVYDPDGTEFDFTWQEDEKLAAQGHSGFDSTSAQTVTWTAPMLDEGSKGEPYTLFVIVNDPEGHSDWAFGEIKVMPNPVDGTLGGDDSANDVKKSGCKKEEENNAMSSAAFFTPFLMLLAWRRRDR